MDSTDLQFLEATNPYPLSHVAGWSKTADGQDLLSRTISQPPTNRSGTSRRLRRFAVVAPVTALVMIAGVFALNQTDGSDPVSPPSARGLESLAQVASVQQPATPQGRQHLKTLETATMFEIGPPAFSYLSSVEVEKWIEPDGSGGLITQPAGFDFPTPEDETAWTEAGSPELNRAPSAKRYETGELSYEDYQGLPTDEDELYRTIKERAGTAGPSPEAEMFIVIGDLLRLGDPPPALRAALFRVTAKIPGVAVEDGVLDAQDRQGIAVSLTYDDRNGSFIETERIYDPATSVLLQETRTIVGKAPFAEPSPPPGFPSKQPGLPPTLNTPVGTVLEQVSYLD